MVLYGISNCDTVKKARRYLEKQQKAYEFHDFRTDGLTAGLLRQWINTVGWETLLNKRSTTWRQLEPAQTNDLNLNKAMQLMLSHPTLIKRPVLDTGAKLIIGFNLPDYQAL